MITAKADISDYVGLLSTFPDKQIPFATSMMLNAIAKDVQVAEREHIHSIFKVRRDQWVDRNVKITHFARKGELYAEIGIVSPGGGDRSDILGKFEDQTSKAPQAGGSAIAIPTDEVRRTGAGVVSRAQRPRAFNFQQAKSSNGNYVVYVGDQHTVLIRRPDGSGVIVRGDKHHVPTERDGTLLYLLKPRVTIRPELHFEQIREQIVERMTATRWQEAAHRALQTAR